jgi:cytochrome c
MKRIVVMMAFSAAIAVVACNGGDNKGTDDKKADSSSTSTTPATNTAAAENEKGLEMVVADNCTTCHKVDEKNIGPAYREVAQKYEATAANIDSLAIKIIKGGQGVWGTIPMTPHPTLSMDSARTMVKYILSLRNP